MTSSEGIQFDQEGMRTGMRTALLVSLLLHLVVGFVSLQIVRFHKVRFIPRQMYTVQIIPAQFQTPQTAQAQPVRPVPQDVAPPPQEKPEEMKPPAEKSKPKPQKKAELKPKKEVPTTELNRVEGAEPSSDEAQPPVTGDMALDVADFPFAYYIASMKRKIATYWSVPAGSRTSLSCRVYFRVDRDGGIQSPAVEESSGSFLFDQAALRAVVESSPLPPLPREFTDNYLGVHFSFAFEKR
jgi:TonB family protein